MACPEAQLISWLLPHVAAVGVPGTRVSPLHHLAAPPPLSTSSPTKYWLNSVFSFSASFSVFLSWLCRRPHLLWLFGFAALDFARGSIMGSSAGGVPMRTRAQRLRGALANAEGSIDPRWRVAGEKHSRAAGHNAGLDVSSL